LKNNKKYNISNCKNIIKKFDEKIESCEQKANKIKIESEKIEARGKCFD
jgi:hypothetical protein